MTAVTVEAGNAAKVTALADLRAELVGVKAYLQRFCTGAFLLYLHAYAVEDTAARLGSSPLVGVETAYLIAIAVPSRPTPPDTTAYLRACGSRLAYSASAGVSRGQLPPGPRGVCRKLRPLVQTLPGGVHHPRSLAGVDGWSRRRPPLHRSTRLLLDLSLGLPGRASVLLYTQGHHRRGPQARCYLRGGLGRG